MDGTGFTKMVFFRNSQSKTGLRAWMTCLAVCVERPLLSTSVTNWSRMSGVMASIGVWYRGAPPGTDQGST